MKPEIYTIKEGYKIYIAKAPINEPKLLYRKEVERRVTHGEISTTGRHILDILRNQLRLLPEEAEAIEAEVLKPYQEYKQKLQQYEQALIGAIEQEYSLSDVTRNDLHDYQQILGLRDEDIAPIEQRLISAAPLTTPLIQKNYRNRQIFLNKVRSYWVKGVLEKSLQGQALISLRLEEQLNLVAHPWRLVSETSDQLQQPLPLGTRVIDLFDQLGIGRTLLILGEPGVGKTTILLELARELINRAEQDINLPIPVIFNLSSWNVKRGGIANWFRNQTIADWLVQELQSQYQVSKQTGQAWVKDQQLLLLLDGLDEVKGNLRDTCVQALNQFSQEYGMEMVVTSRIKEYEALRTRLKFQSAICLSPISQKPFEEKLEALNQGNESEQVLEVAESNIPTEPAVTYSVLLTMSPDEILVGSELEVNIYLGADGITDSNAYLLEISHNEAIDSELNIILAASGFQFDGGNTSSFPLDPSAGQVKQTAHFCLTALRLGAATITAELYRGDTFETNLEARVQVAGFDETSFSRTRITIQPRPAPQPDFILRVQTAWNEINSACRFQYQLRSFRFPSLFSGETNYQSKLLSSSWIEQMRGLLGTTLENISDALPEDGRSRLTSLGQYLFQHLLPTELQTDFLSLIPRDSEALLRSADRTFTLLILADQDASLPWELLHDGQRFLSDRFIMGRWFWELNDTRPHEFPVGAINAAHYADVEQPQLWTALLEPPGSPPPLLLPEGVLGNLDSTEAMRGLHLIRYSQSSDAANRRNAPVTLDDTNNAQDIERQMRPAKLNLRRNRPLVSLGYVRRDYPELTTLEQTWASAFIRAGCSAFTGSLWAVDPAVEAAFISGFYNRLWTGDSLGEAFHASRQLARAVAPDSLDWLAYVLFGDPMARPYRPVEGKGYAVVEPIGREIDDPLPPGVPVRFRLSLRRTPPVWHEERVIEVAENLTFENLQAHVKTFGLQVTPDSPIAMSLAPTGNYLGWFTLVAPPEMAGNSALVQVFLMDGMQPIHSLMFSLNIENEGS